MENNQRNSKRRLNSLILLVAFTAIMLIVSTYAWFSSQKNVTIGNLEGKVNVAEGLMVSLDALNWTQEIDLQSPVLGSWTSGSDTVTGSLATPYNGGSNNLPTEMLPVSGNGVEDLIVDADGDRDYTDSGDFAGKEEMTFYVGTNINGTELHTIEAVDTTLTSSTEYGYPGYFAIDLFLQNSSKIVQDVDGDGDVDETDRASTSFETQGVTTETLQLNADSLLQLLTSGTAELTGLQNTVRVALAMYDYNDGTDLTTGASTESASIFVTATQSQILNAYDGTAIKDIAIWEPNAYDHVDTIVTTNNRLSLDSTVNGLYIASANNKFTADEVVPTYALTKTSLSANAVLQDGVKTGIKDIYDWDGTEIYQKDTDSDGDLDDVEYEAGLGRQIALQTDKSAANYSIYDGGVRNLVSVTSSGAAIYNEGDETGAVTFEMLKNSVIKCRLYVWLEGQDVDCINYASHGGGIHLDLGLVKGATPGGYAS